MLSSYQDPSDVFVPGISNKTDLCLADDSIMGQYVMETIFILLSIMGFLSCVEGIVGVQPERGSCPESPEGNGCYACQGTTLSIACDSGRFIKLKRVTYQGVDHDLCGRSPDRTVTCTPIDVIPILKPRCEGKLYCEFHIGDDLFGDPCLGSNHIKDITMVYDCVKDDNKLYACQDDTMNIECSAGKFIYISSAFYGRHEKRVCNLDDMYDVISKDYNCQAKNTIGKVERLCNGKSSCEFEVTKDKFGDPCGGKEYLMVEYQCVQGTCDNYYTDPNPAPYSYQYIGPRIPAGGHTFTFKVKAQNDVHVVLAAQPSDKAILTEIAVGEWTNETQCSCTQCQHATCTCDQCSALLNVQAPGLLLPKQEKHFYITLKDTCKAGWPLQTRSLSRISLDLEPTGITMVSPDQQLQCHGQVTQWRYIAVDSKPFKAIIWRQTGVNNTFQIVGINVIQPSVLNKQVTFADPQGDRITVRPGDMIGWAYRYASITYNIGGMQTIRWIDGNKYASLKINQNHDFSDNMGKREYSIQAVVGNPGSTPHVEFGIVGQKPLGSRDLAGVDIMYARYFGFNTGPYSKGTWTFCSYLPTSQYRRCVVEAASNFALKSISSWDMTVEKCLAHCRSSGGNLYAALQNGNQCVCGDNFGALSNYAPEDECDKRCAGDKNQICGGVSRNSWYYLNQLQFKYRDSYIRLANGGNSYSGRIELMHDYEFYTICGQGWDKVAADVACRSLGYLGSESFKKYPKFGKGSGKILFNDIACGGDESLLHACNHSEIFATQGCSHDDDVGVICQSWSGIDTSTPWWVILIIILAVLLVLFILFTLYRKSVLQSRHDKTITFWETVHITYCCCCKSQYSSVANPSGTPASTPNAATVPNAGGANGPSSLPVSEAPPTYDEAVRGRATNDSKV